MNVNEKMTDSQSFSASIVVLTSGNFMFERIDDNGKH